MHGEYILQLDNTVERSFDQRGIGGQCHGVYE